MLLHSKKKMLLNLFKENQHRNEFANSTYKDQTDYFYSVLLGFEDP